MVTTAHLGITLLESAQAQKEITVNEALARIDAMLNAGVKDKDLATPPMSPSAGDVYIVAASPAGAWAGRANAIAYFDQLWRFIIPNEGALLWVNDENAHYVFNGTAWQIMETGSASGAVCQAVAGGRLTLTSNVPVTSADVTAATTVYFTPFSGAQIALYTGLAWELASFSQITITVPSTANTNYDVFVYKSGSSVVAETVAWTNATTRATSLVMQDGIYVKSGSPGRRYVGSFRTTGSSGQTEDSVLKRFVWNYNHRVSRALYVAEATNSWAYSTASWR